MHELLSQKYLQEAYKRFTLKYENSTKKHLRVTTISEAVNLPYSTVYNALIKKRNTSSDIFLILMDYFGALKIRNGSITISDS